MYSKLYQIISEYLKLSCFLLEFVGLDKEKVKLFVGLDKEKVKLYSIINRNYQKSIIYK
jgi:hypothetical protein